MSKHLLSSRHRVKVHCATSSRLTEVDVSRHREAERKRSFETTIAVPKFRFQRVLAARGRRRRCTIFTRRETATEDDERATAEHLAPLATTGRKGIPGSQGTHRDFRRCSRQDERKPPLRPCRKSRPDRGVYDFPGSFPSLI